MLKLRAIVRDFERGESKGSACISLVRFRFDSVRFGRKVESAEFEAASMGRGIQGGREDAYTRVSI